MAEFGALQLLLASRPDRDWLVAEIWHASDLLAEVHQQGDGLEVDIFPREDGQAWRLPLMDLVAALSDADTRLIKGRATGAE